MHKRTTVSDNHLAVETRAADVSKPVCPLHYQFASSQDNNMLQTNSITDILFFRLKKA